MSIWAEVKKALNSTVGTTKFKPLNELYLDSRYMYASDTTILHYPTPDGSAYLYDEVYAKIHIPGSYRVIARIRSGTSDGIAKIIVKKGTSTIATYEESGLKNTEERTIACDFTASAGDIIGMRASCTQTGSSSSYGGARFVRLCGMIGTGGAPAEVYTE